MKRLLLGALVLGAILAQSASAQVYNMSGGFPVTAAVAGCTMNGIADLTNTCNNIYLLTGVLK